MLTDTFFDTLYITIKCNINCNLFRNVDVEASDVDAVLEYMAKVAGNQNGFVNPANFRAPDCPKL